MIDERSLLRIAKFFSLAFSPFYLTSVVFAVLLLHGFSRMAYVGYAPSLTGYLVLLFIVLCFTVLIPSVSISFYRRMMRLSRLEMGRRSNLGIPYVMSVLSYLACCVMLYILNVPAYLLGVVVSGLVTVIVCAQLNVWWKVCPHMVALGGTAGIAGVCGIVLGFNPLMLLCSLFIISGVVGTSRMILRQNTLPQVMWSFVIGAVCASYFFLFGV
jgi:hypothetical protein